jgi:F0F1-type ATP synthase delta subunit
MKAERLARVLKRMTDGSAPADHARAIDSFMSYVKARGYQALLPRILSEYQSLIQRTEKGGTTVSLAKKKDHAELLLKHGITGDAKVVIDESLIGGYRIETDSTLIDASHKNALLTLYHSITK